jgi:hypothetical protein
MKIDTISISKSMNTGRISWESSTNDMSYIGINGTMQGPIFGESFSDPTQRYFDFIFDSETAAGEVQDVSDITESISPIEIEPNIKPYISWNAVSDAERYRIYHKEGVSGTEELIDEYLAETTTDYIIRIDEDLNGNGGIWHFFRVEAIDESGNESTRASWRFWIYNVPDAIANLTVENGSGAGLFNITVTP